MRPDTRLLVQLCLGVWVCISNGAIFIFGIFSPQLRSSPFLLSQSDVNIIATVGAVASYVTLPVGLLYDRGGPRAVMIVGALCSLIGWLGVAYVFSCVTLSSTVSGNSTNDNSFLQHYLGSSGENSQDPSTTSSGPAVVLELGSWISWMPPYYVICVFYALSQLSSPFYEQGTVLTNLDAMSSHKGDVVLIQKTFMGLGSSIIAQVYSAYYLADDGGDSDNSNDEDGDHHPDESSAATAVARNSVRDQHKMGGFCLFIAIFSSVAGFLGGIFNRVPPPDPLPPLLPSSPQGSAGDDNNAALTPEGRGLSASLTARERSHQNTIHSSRRNNTIDNNNSSNNSIIVSTADLRASTRERAGNKHGEDDGVHDSHHQNGKYDLDFAKDDDTAAIAPSAVAAAARAKESAPTMTDQLFGIRIPATVVTMAPNDGSAMNLGNAHYAPQRTADGSGTNNSNNDYAIVSSSGVPPSTTAAFAAVAPLPTHLLPPLKERRGGSVGGRGGSRGGGILFSLRRAIGRAFSTPQCPRIEGLNAAPTSDIAFIVEEEEEGCMNNENANQNDAYSERGTVADLSPSTLPNSLRSSGVGRVSVSSFSSTTASSASATSASPLTGGTIKTNNSTNNNNRGAKNAPITTSTAATTTNANTAVGISSDYRRRDVNNIIVRREEKEGERLQTSASSRILRRRNNNLRGGMSKAEEHFIAEALYGPFFTTSRCLTLCIIALVTVITFVNTYWPEPAADNGDDSGGNFSSSGGGTIKSDHDTFVLYQRIGVGIVLFLAAVGFGFMAFFFGPRQSFIEQKTQWDSLYGDQKDFTPSPASASSPLAVKTTRNSNPQTRIAAIVPVARNSGKEGSSENIVGGHLPAPQLVVATAGTEDERKALEAPDEDLLTAVTTAAIITRTSAAAAKVPVPLIERENNEENENNSNNNTNTDASSSNAALTFGDEKTDAADLSTCKKDLVKIGVVVVDDSTQNKPDETKDLGLVEPLPQNVRTKSYYGVEDEDGQEGNDEFDDEPQCCSIGELNQNNKSLHENVFKDKHYLFALLAFRSLVVMGVTTTVSANSSQIYYALAPESYTDTSNAAMVSVFGVASALGRVSAGLIDRAMARAIAEAKKKKEKSLQQNRQKQRKGEEEAEEAGRGATPAAVTVTARSTSLRKVSQSQGREREAAVGQLADKGALPIVSYGAVDENHQHQHDGVKGGGGSLTPRNRRAPQRFPAGQAVVVGSTLSRPPLPPSYSSLTSARTPPPYTDSIAHDVIPRMFKFFNMGHYGRLAEAKKEREEEEGENTSPRAGRRGARSPSSSSAGCGVFGCIANALLYLLSGELDDTTPNSAAVTTTTDKEKKRRKRSWNVLHVSLLPHIALLLAFPLFFVVPGPLLLLPFALVGFATGSLWGGLILAVSHLYGTRFIGAHYGALSFTGMITPIVFNILLFGKTYDAVLRERGQSLSERCVGLECIIQPLLWSTGVNVAGTIACVLVCRWATQRGGM